MKITTSAILATALLIGASSSAYAGTEFYYQTYGGFIKDQHVGDAYGFKPGPDDTTQDGPWYREGPFSKAVQFGDRNSSQPVHNLKDSRDPNGAWPALAWGHVERDPWVSEGGQGDDLGGASGVGLIGYGYEDAVKKGGRKIKVGDDKVLYPFGAAQHHNFQISFMGSMSTKVSWSLELYDKKGNHVHTGNYEFDMNMWETVNFNLKANDCPNTVLSALGESTTDTEFNEKQEVVSGGWWPVTGLDFLFYGDGRPGTTVCADAFGYKGDTGEDYFTVTDKKGKTKAYTVTFEGFYTYLPDLKGCPPLDSGLYNVPADNKDAAWKMKCFKKTPTFWSEEYSENTGYIRLAITEDKKSEETGCTCSDIKDITSLTMTWNGANSTIVTFADGTAFNDGNPVNPGEEVTESWSGKRDNDVIWTLSGETTGESLFHISCSDDNMNDEGDIGNEQGNGKKDEDGYINDWALVDMGGEKGTLTECSVPVSGATCQDIKPLDALALTWTDADHNISKIIVWGKDTTTPLETIDNLSLAQGDQIIVDGLDAGDTNNIIFDLIDQNGDALGSSVFHISCSEDDLDGAEDCGKLVGDGKENSDEYLNLWRFDGMSGEGGDPTEFCTP